MPTFRDALLSLCLLGLAWGHVEAAPAPLPKPKRLTPQQVVTSRLWQQLRDLGATGMQWERMPNNRWRFRCQFPAGKYNPSPIFTDGYSMGEDGNEAIENAIKNYWRVIKNAIENY